MPEKTYLAIREIHKQQWKCKIFHTIYEGRLSVIIDVQAVSPVQAITFVQSILAGRR